MSIRLPYAIEPLAINPIDEKTNIARPKVLIAVHSKKKGCKMLALIDSGADFNMAPIALAEALEIDLSGCPHIEVSGIENGPPVRLFFAPVTIGIGGESIHTHMGFGGDLPDILLGQKGFFDKCREVTFIYPKHVEITVKH